MLYIDIVLKNFPQVWKERESGEGGCFRDAEKFFDDFSSLSAANVTLQNERWVMVVIKSQNWLRFQIIIGDKIEITDLPYGMADWAPKAPKTSMMIYLLSRLQMWVRQNVKRTVANIYGGHI